MARFGYERYDYTRTDYNTTNEYSGKLSADWKPVNWLTVRASGYFADRRVDTHDYFDFVRDIQFPIIISPSERHSQRQPLRGFIRQATSNLCSTTASKQKST